MNTDTLSHGVCVQNLYSDRSMRQFISAGCHPKIQPGQLILLPFVADKVLSHSFKQLPLTETSKVPMALLNCHGL